MEFGQEHLPAAQKVLNRPENSELLALIQCVETALRVGIKFPVRYADELDEFLGSIPGHEGEYDLAWFEERFAKFLPVADMDDFIKKARLAVQQVLTLEHPKKMHHNRAGSS